MAKTTLASLVEDEAARRHAFPVVEEQIYMAHAGVTALPRAASDAMRAFLDRAERGNQEMAWMLALVAKARESAAALIGAQAEEIALLGPTSLGLSLVALGLPWEAGDEVVYYDGDYPANVYPWSSLEERGVKGVRVKTRAPGVITWDTVEPALTERTRLVALASCNFLSGYRIDVDAIGKHLQERNVLFSVDGIQTVGAFDTPVEHVDFLSADSHKWMLGPAAAGIFYVKKSRWPLLKPALLGAWNVHSPDFIAQDSIQLHDSARRYEPGILNLPGIVGMGAAIDLLLGVGVPTVSVRLLELRRGILDGVRPLGYRLCLEEWDLGPSASDRERTGIVTVTHPDRDLDETWRKLSDAKIAASLRRNRAGQTFIRFSPHFYNTFDEIDRVVEVLK